VGKSCGWQWELRAGAGEANLKPYIVIAGLTRNLLNLGNSALGA
jgi:hypothetical protein